MWWRVPLNPFEIPFFRIGNVFLFQFKPGLSAYDLNFITSIFFRFSNSRIFPSLYFLKKNRFLGRERNISVREKQQLAASPILPDCGMNPQPEYVPQPGIEATSFWCTGWHSNQLSHTGQGSLSFSWTLIIGFFLLDYWSYSSISIQRKIYAVKNNNKIPNLTFVAGKISGCNFLDTSGSGVLTISSANAFSKTHMGEWMISIGGELYPSSCKVPCP